MPNTESNTISADEKRTPPPLSLLTDLIVEYPFQPATAFWRWFEIDAINQHGLPDGYGLDLGCGDGRLTRLVFRSFPGRKLMGIEPDAEELALAQGESLYAQLECAGGDHIPAADNTFDFVFSNSVLEHIPAYQAVLAEACRVLKPGGTFVATVPSSDLPRCFSGPGLLWRTFFESSRSEYLQDFDRRLLHLYYLNDEAWESTLREAGFTRVMIKNYFPRLAVRRFETIANCTSGVLFRLFGRRKRPIEIQRTLKLRRNSAKTPRPVARMIGAGLACRVRKTTNEELFGGRLIYAIKA